MTELVVLCAGVVVAVLYLGLGRIAGALEDLNRTLRSKRPDDRR